MNKNQVCLKGLHIFHQVKENIGMSLQMKGRYSDPTIYTYLMCYSFNLWAQNASLIYFLWEKRVTSNILYPTMGLIKPNHFLTPLKKLGSYINIMKA